MNIIECNELIGEFMGYKSSKKDYYKIPNKIWNSYNSIGSYVNFHSSNLLFDKEWNWLMPVWGKFVKLYHELGKNRIYNTRKLRSEFADAIDKGDINKCHEILVTGIKWYNENK